MIQLTLEIICENFEQLNIEQQKIYTNEQREEYYVIPLNKNYTMEYTDTQYKLTFTNQLLWLKYSTQKKHILLDEYPYKECVIIKSQDIHDIYCKIQCNNYFRKNIWQSYNVAIKKQDIGKHYLVIPILDDMVDIHEFGVAGNFNQIEVITNEVLMKQVHRRSEHGGNIVITSNTMLCKEAIFIKLTDEEINSFLETDLISI